MRPLEGSVQIPAERERQNRRNCGEVLLLLCIVGMRADPSKQWWSKQLECVHEEDE